MNYNDISKAITAEDIIRRYNLDNLKVDRKTIRKITEDLTKTNTQINEFANAVTKDIEELQDQVDGNIATWFFYGVPNLENRPANEWQSEEEKNNHLGDLYYDQDTGYAYRFALKDDEYEWLEIKDTDVTKALALANSAQDTADRKRTTFVDTPLPPYEVGDLWVKEDKELYRCRAKRVEGEFRDVDWVLATDYSNDDYAKNVEAVLDQFKKTVTTDYVTNVTFETTRDSIESKVESTTKKVETIEQTLDYFSVDLDIYNITIPVSENNIPLFSNTFIINHNSSFKGEQVSVKPSYTSDIKGITVETTIEDIKISISNDIAIDELINELNFIFLYKDGEDSYVVNKKIMVTLAQKGANGKDGEQGLPGKDGEKGEKGEVGTNGKDGKTQYFHYKFSDDGETFTPGDEESGIPIGKTRGAYIGIYSDFTEEDSNVFEDYTWIKFTGDVDALLDSLQNQINSNASSLQNNYQELNDKLNDKADKEVITELRNSITEVTDANAKVTTAVEEIIQNGVSQVVTETNMKFDKDGLSIDKTGAETSSSFNEKGLGVKDKTGSTEKLLSYNGYVDEELAQQSELLKKFLGQTVNYANNSLIERYLSFLNWRIEEVNDSVFGKGLGFFYVGGDK